MKILCGLLAAVTAFGISPAGRGEKSDDPGRAVLEKTVAAYRDLRTYRDQTRARLQITGLGDDQVLESRLRVAVERPGKLAMVEEEGGMRLTLVSDGEKVWTYFPWDKKLTVAEAPEKIEELLAGGEWRNVKTVVMGWGVMIISLFGESPEETLLKDVRTVEARGEEELEGVRTRHLVLRKDDMDIELWIGAEDYLVRRVRIDMTGALSEAEPGKMKVIFEEVHGEIETGGEIPEGTFVFQPPAKAGDLVSGAACSRREASPGKEIPAAPDASTTRDYKQELLAFNRRTIVGAYREFGSRNPRWDEAAIEFLENVSREFTGLPDAPSTPELLAEGEKLAEAGCDDPMVLYGYGTALQSSQDWDEAEKYVRRARDGLIARNYPVNRVLFATRRLIEIHEFLNQKKELRRLRELYYEKLLETLQSDIYREGEERILLDHVASGIDLIRGYSVSQLDEFAETIKELPGIDPWVRDTLAGMAHIKLAWASRGGGWAQTVDKEGWRGFGEHLSEARRHLIAAWEAHTDYPEAPSHMITVAMGGGSQPGEDERFWFDRAAAAQFDYQPAYNKLFWALRPRWHGSHDQMYALGLECLKTERFDTKVPEELIWALIKIEKDLMDDRYWRRPGVYENVEAVFKGIEEEPSRTEKDKRYHRSLHAAIAWCIDDFDEAERLLDELGDDVSEKALEDMGTSLAGMRWDISRSREKEEADGDGEE